MTNINLYCGNCVDIMKTFHDEMVDLTITSPPYDNLRDYNGYVFDFEAVVKEIYRITKVGGVCVWVVADQTKNYCESLTSFKQAIYFTEVVGFNLLDTMIYHKNGGTPSFPGVMRYSPKFEYMFVFSKGKPKTFNPIMYKKKWANLRNTLTQRQKDGTLKKQAYNPSKNLYAIVDNVWKYDVGGGKSSKDKIAYKHPAIFPERLAEDHILSWSNKGDIIFDPMMGSGTTGKMAKLLERNFIGIDISQEYVDIANERINSTNMLGDFFG